LKVERALILWRDDHLKYDRDTLKHLRKTSAQDFSGTNYKSITLGWLERIREKRKKDNTYFAKVCKEAYNLYLATGKGKSPATGSGSADKHSDLEIEERVGVMSDSDDSDLDEGNIAKGMLNPSRDAMPDADEGANDDGNARNSDADEGNGDEDNHGGDDEDNGDAEPEDNGDDEDDCEEMYASSGHGDHGDDLEGNGGGSEGFEL